MKCLLLQKLGGPSYNMVERVERFKLKGARGCFFLPLFPIVEGCYAIRKFTPSRHRGSNWYMMNCQL